MLNSYFFSFIMFLLTDLFKQDHIHSSCITEVVTLYKYFQLLLLFIVNVHLLSVQSTLS